MGLASLTGLFISLQTLARSVVQTLMTCAMSILMRRLEKMVNKPVE